MPNISRCVRPKDQTSTTKIVDQVSPAHSPEKSTTDLEVLSVMNVQNVEEANDFEEHQEKKGEQRGANSNRETIKNSIQSHGDVKLKFIPVPR